MDRQQLRQRGGFAPALAVPDGGDQRRPAHVVAAALVRHRRAVAAGDERLSPGPGEYRRAGAAQRQNAVAEDPRGGQAQLQLAGNAPALDRTDVLDRVQQAAVEHAAAYLHGQSRKAQRLDQRLRVLCDQRRVRGVGAHAAGDADSAPSQAFVVQDGSRLRPAAVDGKE